MCPCGWSPAPTAQALMKIDVVNLSAARRKKFPGPLYFHAIWYYPFPVVTSSVKNRPKINGLDFLMLLDNNEYVRTGRVTIEDGRLVWSPDTDPSLIDIVSSLSISADPATDPETFLYYVWAFIRSPYYYAALIDND